MQRTRTKRSRKKLRATTKDVVPITPQKENIPPRWREHFKSLMQLRDSLLHQQADLTKDALEEQPSFSTHMADAATDSFDRDFALSLLSSEQNAVYEIDEALARIRNGTYGICELTGKKIEAERLKALPWT